MTTIAYRDGVLAADTLSARGYTSMGVKIIKIARGPDGRLGGGCGAAGFLGPWLEWIRGERETRPEPRERGEDCDTGLVIYPSGQIEIHEAGGFFVVEGPYYAMGTGRDQALGAMFVGATAEQAVEAARQHDVYTGGEITVLRAA